MVSHRSASSRSGGLDDHASDTRLEVQDQANTHAVQSLDAVAEPGADLLIAEQPQFASGDTRIELDLCVVGDDDVEPSNADARRNRDWCSAGVQVAQVEAEIATGETVLAAHLAQRLGLSLI